MRWCIAVCSAGVAVGACGTSTTSPTTTPGSTTRPAVTTTTAASTATAGAGGQQGCAASRLAGTVTGSSGAAGTIETTIALRNASSATCVLDGYPGMQLVAAGGAPLPTTVVRKGSDSFTAMAPAPVTLAPGGSGYVNVGSSDVPVGGETTCPASSSLEVIPPNAVDHLVIAVALVACGQGTLTVSPVFSDTGSNTLTTAPAR